MSDDIVARLLRFRPVYDWPEETSTVVEKPLNQVAVDEITRLRAELAAVTAERDRVLEALKSADLMTREIHADLKEKCQRIYYAFYATRAALEGVTEKEGAGNE